MSTDLELDTPPLVRICVVDSCPRPARRARWCTTHYGRLYNKGTSANPRRQMRTGTPIWLQVVNGITRDAQGCWIWNRYIDRAGYPRLPKRGHGSLAHRLSYEAFVGPIPAGLTLDHLCRVPACVNPAHLEPVTLAENIRRTTGYSLKTHCKRGHEFTPENTYLKGPNGINGRACRACAITQSVIRQKALRAQKRSAAA